MSYAISILIGIVIGYLGCAISKSGSCHNCNLQKYKDEFDNFQESAKDNRLCSGLKDVNGKMIYEGDIIKILDIPRFFWIPYDEIEETAKVVFDKGMFMVRFEKNGSSELYLMNNYIEVIEV